MRILLATLLLLSAALAGAQPAAQEAPVVVYGRMVAVFRTPFLGLSPADRAQRTQQALSDLLARGGPGEVTVQKEPQGRVILIDGALALILVPQDADVLRGETLDTAAAAAVQRLSRVVADTRESRDRGRIAWALAYALAATLLYLLCVAVVVRLRRRLHARTVAWVHAKTQRAQLAGTPLWHPARAELFAQWLLRVVSWVLLALLSYEWLVFVLQQFPRTRALGEQLGGFVLAVGQRIGGGVLHALPDLAVAVVIFLLARAATGVLRPVFERVEQGQAQVAWLDRDLARPTRRIVNLGIWLFAVVMAYPYLPGSDSDAFKGMSVLVGLMITLGGSNLVGQAASGMILMYSRTLRVGEYVRIGDTEGTVVDMGSFTTRIRTGVGEEITLPNALVMGTATCNYSRAVQGAGYIIDTTVTIGYDTPWREVEAILLEAARRTPGVLASPPPIVLQRALSDFYVEYRLAAQAVPETPRARAITLHMLHASIQDVFNEHGVQIMSPHYLGDPQEAKVVPPDHPYAAPPRSGS